MVAPLSNLLAALIAFRTIYGIFAINYTTLSTVNRTVSRLIALIMARLVFGAIVIITGRMLINSIDTEAVHQLVKENMAHLIRFATKEASYMEEMNRLQQSLQCCGMSTDIQLQNGNLRCFLFSKCWVLIPILIIRGTCGLLHIRWMIRIQLQLGLELYSLPWSCCNRTKNLRCEHIGVTRYLRTFDTPTDFYDIEKAIGAKQLNWNPTTFERYLDRNELAIATLYQRDCSVELFREVLYRLEAIKNLMQQTGYLLEVFKLLW
ncbi:hypothetical protein DICVIV_14041 [Dictyocaulus viviparus]|uniref:Uncharacterized protein n=1 Tax=Dictyocaulus viviparus TaxID=29172 RepID=A0A0D8X676_DICVI|nr:hypothetical protein DICVIV_14041 [Dictyocaulus viviparus]